MKIPSYNWVTKPNYPLPSWFLDESFSPVKETVFLLKLNFNLEQTYGILH